jgi:hypothetical protein
MRGQRRQAMRRWCSQVRRLAILAVALAGFGGEAAAAALDAGQAGARVGELPGRALLRLHVTSYANIQAFNEEDWDVIITTSGEMWGFTTCCAELGEGCWISVANTAHMSTAQLRALGAALESGHVGLLYNNCLLSDGGELPGNGASSELQWYGRNQRENFFTLFVGPAGPANLVPPTCSAGEVNLFKVIDDLVINVLGFPPTIAPKTPINRANACLGTQG